MHSLCSTHDVVLCLVLGELYFPFSFGFGCVFGRRERLKCWHCCPLTVLHEFIDSHVSKGIFVTLSS